MPGFPHDVNNYNPDIILTWARIKGISWYEDNMNELDCLSFEEEMDMFLATFDEDVKITQPKNYA